MELYFIFMYSNIETLQRSHYTSVQHLLKLCIETSEDLSARNGIRSGLLINNKYEISIDYGARNKSAWRHNHSRQSFIYKSHPVIHTTHMKRIIIEPSNANHFSSNWM